MTADEKNQDENTDPPSGGAAAGPGKEEEKVSQTSSSEKNVEKPDYAVHAAQHVQKLSKQQTEKSGLAALLQFVSDSLLEARKVTWPDRQQVIKETISVIILVALITGCVLAFDYGIGKAVFEPLDKLARHMGGGIGVHH